MLAIILQIQQQQQQLFQQQAQQQQQMLVQLLLLLLLLLLLMLLLFIGSSRMSQATPSGRSRNEANGRGAAEAAEEPRRQAHE